MFFRMSDTSNWVSHTLEVRLAASNLLIQMQDAETGERGYLLTGQDDFLEPYRTASVRIKPDFARLRRATLDDEAQQKTMDRLAPLIDSKFAVIEEVLSLARQGKKDQAGALAVPGKAVMDEIRTAIAEIVEVEKDGLGGPGACGQARPEHFALPHPLRPSRRISAGRHRDALPGPPRERTCRRRPASGKRRKRRFGRLRRWRPSGSSQAASPTTSTIFSPSSSAISTPSAAGLPRSRPMASAQLARPLEGAMQGARSAAKLTHRLLAFSRLQPLDPVPMDLNKTIAGISDLLMRTVGSPITVETVLAGGLWRTMADVNQLENVLVNLAINAKDAMPEGGKITIETANGYLDDAYAASFGDVSPGQYVVLSVTDTGTGIPPEVLERVFEPFFTTKQAGMGTGLGLSMVHGFVKQSGGHVRIYSEVGHGTSVKIYLPRLPQEAAMAAAPKALDPDPKPLAAANGWRNSAGRRGQ